MTVKADSKKRVIIPDAAPGDVFAYENRGGGRFTLARLMAPPPRKKMTKSQVLRALDRSKGKYELTWEELRALTREP